MPALSTNASNSRPHYSFFVFRSSLQAAVMSDLRYALRSLRKAPAFTTIAMLTLAIGIGATTAVFSVVHAVLLSPLPYPDPQRLVRLEWEFPRGDHRIGMSGREVRLLGEESRSFQAMTAIRGSSCDLAGGGDPERVPALHATARVFDTLGVAPMLGRPFTAADDQPGAPPVTVLMHDLWRRRFGGDRAAVGRTIRCNGEPVLIVGVLPPAFRFTPATDMWLPLRLSPRDPLYSGINYRVIARLKPDVTPAALDVDLAALTAARRQVSDARGRGYSAVDFGDVLTSDVRTPLLLLFAALATVLLIGCANNGGLLLARGVQRRREIAVRAALGAGRRQILRQLLIESALLSAAGGLIGLIVAWWSMDFLRTIVASQLPHVAGVGINPAVGAFVLLLVVATALLAGVVPAVAGSRVDLNDALRSGGRGATGHQHTRQVLIAGEIALSLVLVVVSLLLLRTLGQLQAVPLGVDPNGVQFAQVSLGAAKYARAEPTAEMQRQVVDRLNAIPGVVAASASSLPLTGGLNLFTPRVTGRECEPNSIDYRAVSAEYFAILRLPRVKGRVIAASDTRTSQPVAVVNEAMVRFCWGEEDAMGAQLQFGYGTPDEDSARQIVGVVADFRDHSPRRPTRPTVYVPQSQAPDAINELANRIFPVAILVRADRSVAAELRAAIRTVDPDAPIVQAGALTDIARAEAQFERVMTTLLAVFAGLGQLLTALGIYGLFSFQVTQRRQEIGIRMALGATQRTVVRMVLRQTVLLVAIGTAVGMAGAYYATRALGGILFGVKPLDAISFAGAIAIIAIAAMAASLPPARRASKVDPVIALRTE
jgi:putative ABC transport system permease protein